MSITNLNKPDYSGDQNPVVNGNMAVHQRVSAVSVPNGTVVYTLDQWVAYQDGSATISVSQQATALNETGFLPEAFPSNYLRWAQTTTGASATNTQLVQRIENTNLFAGLWVTLSFWARNSINNATLTVEVGQTAATGGGNSTAQTFNLTTAWKKYKYTTLVTNSVTALNSNSCFNVRFKPQYNLIQNFDLTLVQIDRGMEAKPFKHETFDANLKRCQRYFQKSFDYSVAPANGSGTLQGATMFQVIRVTVNQFGAFVPTQVRLRAATNNVVFYNPAGGATGKAYDVTTAAVALATALQFTGETGFVFYSQPAAAAVQGSVYAVHHTISAEI